MSLELDARQRAMLQEMGVPVWLPESGVAVLERPVSEAAAVRAAAAKPIAAPTAGAAAPAARDPGVGARPAPAPAAPAAPVQPARISTPVVVAEGTDWATLQDTVQQCQACTLCAGRSHTTLVPPTDLAPCDWMVVGDPPDEDEDRAGAPFAGTDGQLLANMLKAVGAATAYRTNVLKCRPALGAVAQAAELGRCSAYLQQEIALVKPKVILSLGRFANQVLLGETPELAGQPLGKLRGAVHSYQGRAVVVSYPPKLLMRNGADKAKAWADLCLAAAALESKIGS